MKTILIVDDISTNRVLLKKILLAFDDFKIIEAVNGYEAITQFEKETPDLILMDVMMPEMDGCQASSIIKEKTGDDYIPIIFVTALSSDDSLTTALESGGDDFVSKPFNVGVLESKIKAHLRIRELNQQINDKNDLLENVNQNLIYEQELIEHFFERAIQQSFLDENIIRYHMSSMSAFNGDLLLSERGSEGGFYLITGDFTGHGLTAAMGTLPVAMIFFKMVAEGSSVSDIAREINLQLYNLMPTSMFFVATIIELSAQGDTISVWMGGMPASYWLSKEGNLKGTINAQHMPLGVLGDSEFDSSIQLFNVNLEDKIYLCSDGIVEAKNSEGTLFGDERFKNILIDGGVDRFDKVLQELNKFTGKNNQNDDITFIELNCLAVPAQKVIKEKNIEDAALLWNISVSLSAKEMRAPDPVAKLSSILCVMPYLSNHRGALHVLLSEIYSNSLEHSILNLGSEYKKDEEHFVEYYNKRDDALRKLENASIDFDFSFIFENDQHYLEIKISDSGTGYHDEHNNSNNKKDILFGRGLDIISGLSEKILFSDDGKTMNVLYKL